MLQKIFKLFGVWAAILLAAFILLEISFRLFRHEKNPLRLVVQKRQDVLFEPGASFRNVSSVPGEYDYLTHINSYGFRGKEFAMPKPQGVTRILAVGDSFTHGVGAEDDQTIPALLESDLKAKGHLVEVVNAGAGGTSAVSQFVNTRNIYLKYQPDLVVFFFDLTDLWDDWHFERQAIFDKDGEIVRFDPLFKYGKRDWWATAIYYSKFLRYFNDKVVRSFVKIQTLGFKTYFKAIKEGKKAKALIANASEGKAKEAAIEYDGVLFMRGKAKEDLILEHWPRSQKYLLKMRDLLGQNGIPMVIVMYPHGIYVDGDQWKEGRKAWGFEPGKRYDDYLAFDLMRRFAQDNRIPFVNTLEAFLKAPKDKYFFDWDGHMMTNGNAIVADTLADDENFIKAIDGLKR